MTTGRTDTAAGSSAVAYPRPPVLTTPNPSRLHDGGTDELAAGKMVEDLELVETDLNGGDLSALTLFSCRFLGVFANDADLAVARLVDCCLERLSATYLHSPHSTWRMVELISSHIGAWGLYDADVESLLMRNYRLGFTNLAGTTVRDLLIQATRIGKLDLSGIDTQRVHFEDCWVGALRLHGGSLNDVDLRGLKMRTASGVGSLAGMAISSG